MELTEYTEKTIGLFGVAQAFKLAHIPFLTVEDSYGVLALEGSSGTGKTTLIKRLGLLNQAATGGKVGIYSADKARYEDFIGCPIPDEETKKMHMYPMPNAIANMETVLIDEANRASYDNQEKYLSLIASRVIDGFPVNCKYLYIAMNPVMTDGSEVYEGVQPLDKAFGERVMGLVTMRPFHNLPKEDQINIMTASFNQTTWQPTEEMVKLHVAFIERAKEIYQKAKEDILPNVCEYVCRVQKDLAEMTDHSITIEARRAQFLMINILATYALNSITMSSKNVLEQSALEALEISFPHRLWEQEVQPHQLEHAHNAAKQLLNYNTAQLNRSAGNFEGVLGPINEIKEVVEKASDSSDLSKEEITKLINTKLPDVKRDPINHYVYALAVREGLTEAAADLNGPGSDQKTIKRNEFSRMKRIADNINSNPEFEVIKDAGEGLNSNSKYPDGFAYPWYIDVDSDEVGKLAFDDTIKFEIGWYAHVIMTMHKEEVHSSGDYLDILEKTTKAIKEFKKIAIDFSNLS